MITTYARFISFHLSQKILEKCNIISKILKIDNLIILKKYRFNSMIVTKSKITKSIENFNYNKIKR